MMMKKQKTSNSIALHPLCVARFRPWLTSHGKEGLWARHCLHGRVHRGVRPLLGLQAAITASPGSLLMSTQSKPSCLINILVKWGRRGHFTRPSNERETPSEGASRREAQKLSRSRPCSERVGRAHPEGLFEKKKILPNSVQNRDKKCAVFNRVHQIASTGK